MGIGPSTKETTLHNFRDPLLDVVSADEDLDLMGILIVGTPQDQQDKVLVGTRAAVWARGRRDHLCRRMGKQRCRLCQYNRTARKTRHSGGGNPLFRNGRTVRGDQSVYGYDC